MIENSVMKELIVIYHRNLEQGNQCGNILKKVEEYRFWTEEIC